MNATQILALEEIMQVLADLKRKSKRSINARINNIIFRLSCCCGLRRCEISGLIIRDIILSTSRPVIKIRREITKGRKGKRRTRLVPLWWDSGTLTDIERWIDFLRAEGCIGTSPVVYAPRSGLKIPPDKISLRWRTAIKCLGDERREQVSVHAGRHSFVSHALHRGRSLAEVRDAVGHGSIDTTSIYAHALVDEECRSDLFGGPNPHVRKALIRFGRTINRNGEEV